MNNSTVVAVVANYKYLRKYFNNFISQIRVNGKYSGEVLIITSYFTPTFLISKIRKDVNVKIVRFKNVNFSTKTINNLKNLNTGLEPNRYKTKKFQWNKIHLFDTFLKKWDFVFYLDLNMQIHHDINNILDLKPKNVLFARSDSYPENKRTLSSQFDKEHKIYEKLSKEFNLSTTKYFQTGILYFDTKIVNPKTKKEILALADKYPLSITNEQGIMNLYFKFQLGIYEELPLKIENKTTYFYWLLENEEVIVTKQNRIQYK